MGSERQVILCVDDEAIILLSMKQELRRRFGDRFSIETALSAEDADRSIDELESEGATVALVICDWIMPGKHGDRFLIDLHERRPDIKAILLTGQADDMAVTKAREEAEICYCLNKPWRAEDMARAIESCLAGLGSAS